MSACRLEQPHSQYHLCQNLLAMLQSIDNLQGYFHLKISLHFAAAQRTTFPTSLVLLKHRMSKPDGQNYWREYPFTTSIQNICHLSFKCVMRRNSMRFVGFQTFAKWNCKFLASPVCCIRPATNFHISDPNSPAVFTTLAQFVSSSL